MKRFWQFLVVMLLAFAVVGCGGGGSTHEHTACAECGKCTAADCDGAASDKCAGHTAHTHVACAECGKCTSASCTGAASEKCAGHGAHTHVACPECGKCTSASCTGAASEKCAGHGGEHVHAACPECGKCTAAGCDGEQCEGHSASNLTCAEDPTQAKCGDPATWDWKFNRFEYNGKGAIIKLLHGAPDEIDPESPTFTGKRKEEKQLQLYDIETAYNIDLVIEKFPDAAAWGPDRVAWINGLAQTNTTDKGDIFAIASDWVPSLVEGKSIALLETVKMNSSTKQYDQKGGIFSDLNYTQVQEKIKQYKVGNSVYGYSAGETHADFFLYYNQDLIEEYSLEDPATLWNNGQWDWAKFMEFLRTAQTAFGSAEETGMYAFGGWVNEVARGALAARGGKFVDLEAELVLFTNQTVVQMYEDLRTIKREGMWASATGDVCPGFTAGTQLFQPAQLWFLSSTMRFASADPNNPTCDFEISVVPYPTATGDGMAKEEYTVPMGSDSGYAIRNIASAESGLTAEILLNISSIQDLPDYDQLLERIKVLHEDNDNSLFDFREIHEEEDIAKDMTDEEAYRLYLKKYITSEQSIEAIMSVENNLSSYGYTDYLDVVSKSLGNGSDWQGEGFYTWGLELLDLEKDVATILSSHQAYYQSKLQELIA